MASNKNERDIGSPGFRLTPNEVFLASIEAVTADNKAQIISKNISDDNSDASKLNAQYLLFKFDNTTHLITFPVFDGKPDEMDSIQKGKQNSLEQFITKVLPDIKKTVDIDKIHRHYFICQAYDTAHYVYAHLTPEKHLTIKDSFPRLRYYAHEDEVKNVLVPKTYQYENTGDQYNTTDCGHYVIRHFLQEIGIRDENSFWQNHRKTIGFVIGSLLVGAACALAIFFTAGFAAIGIVPLAIATSASVGGGLVGAIWAETAEDARLSDERIENSTCYKEQAAILFSHSNAATLVSQMPGTEESDDEWAIVSDKKNAVENRTPEEPTKKDDPTSLAGTSPNRYQHG